MSSIDTEEDNPYHQDGVRDCKKCGEPKMVGFIHVCNIRKDIDRVDDLLKKAEMVYALTK